VLGDLEIDDSEQQLRSLPSSAEALLLAQRSSRAATTPRIGSDGGAASFAGGSSARLGGELCEVVRRYDRLGDGTAVAITAEYLQAVGTWGALMG
jgi:hypothetical protein